VASLPISVSRSARIVASKSARLGHQCHSRSSLAAALNGQAKSAENRDSLSGSEAHRPFRLVDWLEMASWCSKGMPDFAMIAVDNRVEGLHIYYRFP
jgi:hypothetical protein